MNGIFLNESSLGEAGTYYWSFGDGTTANEFSPFHQYTEAGNYQVCLYMYEPNGSCSDTLCQWITVMGDSTSNGCSPAFGVENQSGSTVQFVNYSTEIASSFHWDFGDSTFSTETSPLHTFPAEGLYGVCLTQTALDGSCSETYCMTVWASDSLPNNDTTCYASFFVDEAWIVNDLSYVFMNTSSAPAAATFVWSFGDGTTSNEYSPVHQYAAEGPYEICLQLTGSNGCSSSICHWIYATDSTWVDSTCYAYPSYSVAQDSVDGIWIAQFSHQSVGSYTNVTWTFPDGTVSNLDNPTHVFYSEGPHAVTLTVSSPDGSCFDEQTVWASHLPQPGGYGFLSGSVWTGANALADHTAVLLIHAVADSLNNTWLFEAVDTFFVHAVDSGGFFFGEFRFENIPYGTYFLRAHLTDQSAVADQFLPTYYDSTLSWENAFAIHVAPVMLPFQYDIHLVPVEGFQSGPGSIGGGVFEGVNGKTSSEGDPLAGVVVQLFNESDQPVAYAFTGTDGSYSFGSLGYGTYKIQPEHYGLHADPIYVTLSPENPTEDEADVTMQTTVVTANDRSEASTLALALYPNPTSGEVTLSFSAAGSVRIAVMDAQGRTLQTNAFTAAGQTQYSVSLNGLPAGLYLVRLEAGSAIRTARFVKR